MCLKKYGKFVVCDSVLLFIWHSVQFVWIWFYQPVSIRRVQLDRSYLYRSLWEFRAVLHQIYQLHRNSIDYLVLFCIFEWRIVQILTIWKFHRKQHYSNSSRQEPGSKIREIYVKNPHVWNVNEKSIYGGDANCNEIPPTSLWTEPKWPNQTHINFPNCRISQIYKRFWPVKHLNLWCMNLQYEYKKRRNFLINAH